MSDGACRVRELQRAAVPGKETVLGIAQWAGNDAKSRRADHWGPAFLTSVSANLLQDETAICKLAGLAMVEVVGLEHLQLQRHGKAVLHATLAQPHQHLAALDQGAHDQRLEACEVGVRIPTKPAMHSKLKPATYSSFIPASIPI